MKKGQTVCIIEAMKLMNEIEVRTVREMGRGEGRWGDGEMGRGRVLGEGEGEGEEGYAEGSWQGEQRVGVVPALTSRERGQQEIDWPCRQQC